MKRILVDSGEYGTRIGVVEDGLLAELVYERKNSMPIVGNIYMGKVVNVLPGMQAAFVDIGEDKNAFLYYGDNKDEKGNIIKPKNGSEILVQVEKGISAEELGQLLEDKGLVRDHNLFYLQLKLSAYSGHIKPGIYTLNTSMTAKDMMVIMSSDKSDEEQTQTVEPSDTQ